MQGRAQLKIKATGIFWKADTEWRGECLELPAQVRGPTLDAVYMGLYNECYRVGAAEIERGRLPGRPTSAASADALHCWHTLRDGTPERTFHEVRRMADKLSQVVVAMDIALQIDVPEMLSDPGLGPLRIVFLCEDNTWIAQCLEFDIGGEGKTQQEAAGAVFEALLARISMDRALGKKPLSGVPRAPERFFEMYSRGKPTPIDTLDGPDLHGEFVTAA